MQTTELLPATVFGQLTLAEIDGEMTSATVNDTGIEFGFVMMIEPVTAQLLSVKPVGDTMTV